MSKKEWVVCQLGLGAGFNPHEALAPEVELAELLGVPGKNLRVRVWWLSLKGSVTSRRVECRRAGEMLA